MKKLVWCHPHLQYFMGGTKFLLEVIQRLQKYYDVTVICNTGNKDILQKFKKANVNVIRISFISTNSAWYWLFFPFFLAFDYVRVRTHLDTADHIIGCIYPSNLICALYSTLRKKRFYFLCYEPFPFFHHREFMKSFSRPKTFLLRLLSLLYGWTDIWAAKKAAKIFTLDHHKAKLITKVYKKDPLITSVGMDFKVFRFYTVNRIKKKYKNRIIITHSTDYTAFKNTDLAIKTILHLKEKYPAILLIITSTIPFSPNRQKYVKQVEKLGLKRNVLFAGFLPSALLPLYYSASICYLSTLTHDIVAGDWPAKEALACEVPVLRSKIGTGDVQNNISGFIIDPQKTVEVAKKIEYLIKNPIHAKEMGKKGRELMIKKYSWDSVINVIIRVLEG